MSSHDFCVGVIPIRRMIGDKVLEWNVPIYGSDFNILTCKFYANFDNGYVNLTARSIEEMEMKIWDQIDIYMCNSSRFSHASISD